MWSLKYDAKVLQYRVDTAITCHRTGYDKAHIHILFVNERKIGIIEENVAGCRRVAERINAKNAHTYIYTAAVHTSPVALHVCVVLLLYLFLVQPEVV